jgi:hypothetical protein
LLTHSHPCCQRNGPQVLVSHLVRSSKPFSGPAMPTHGLFLTVRCTTPHDLITCCTHVQSTPVKPYIERHMCARHSLMAMTGACQSCHQLTCAPAALHPCCRSPACRHPCQHPQAPARSWCASNTAMPFPHSQPLPSPAGNAPRPPLPVPHCPVLLTPIPRLLQPWHSALPAAPSRQLDQPTGGHPLASTLPGTLARVRLRTPPAYMQASWHTRATHPSPELGELT